MKAIRLGMAALALMGSIALSGCPAKDKAPGPATMKKDTPSKAAPSSQPAEGAATATKAAAPSDKPAGNP